MSETAAARSRLFGFPILFFITSVLILFLGFYRNQWNAAPEKKFSNVDKVSESFILGRLVQSRQDGIFSQAGLLGLGDTTYPNIEQSNIDNQYDSYFNGGRFSIYFPYRSQIGFQGVIFSLIDAVAPFAPEINLRVFRGMNSLLISIALGLLLLWMYQEFGLFAALVAFVTSVRSQWLTVFGRNLFWSIWLYFVPLLAATFFLARESRRKANHNFKFAAVVFGTVFFKCAMSGYDFIPTVAISIGIPLVYYAIVDRWGWFRLIQRGLLTLGSVIAAVIISLVLLAGQIGSLTGNYRDGAEYIMITIGRRTYGDPSRDATFEASLSAKVTDVLIQYLTEDEIFRRIPLHFIHVTLVFLFFTVAFFLYDVWRSGAIEPRMKAYGLIAATWVAFLGSISTYIIFKGASYIHTFLYYIVWHLPYTIFGFALCGYVLTVIFRSLATSSVQAREESKLT